MLLLLAFHLILLNKKFFEFFAKWETEVGRIFREECREDPKIAAQLLLGHTNRLREENGMEPFDDEVLEI